MSKKVDIDYIAKAAGVSRSTVSRVLTNSSNVKEETKEKILRVMKEANYHPSIMARGLATGKLEIIALIVSDIRNPFYSELVWVINNNLQEKGYLMTLYNSSQIVGENDQHLRKLLDYGFSGIIIADARNEVSFSNILKSANCPIVLVNREIGFISKYDSISVDNKMGGYLATNHLLSLGHQKIAMLRGPQFSTTSQGRYDGYLYAMEEYGLTPNPKYVVSGSLNMESGQRFVHELLINSDDPPTAVFVGGDLMCYGVMDECIKNGIRIPEDISIVGFDDIPLSKASFINLTTIRHPYDMIGSMVAKRIIERINGNDEPISKTVLTPTLQVRGSTRAI
ncbi:LacI family DNA-binding transcriptional regulator [Desnuesiella massiliensis]|uniref:LacI family DNA-binding transcriptional regulator n=1 Tax=Desnuesiella massiliensis TaxID=1650662 RepID=UPI0006E3C301|nr:LacI family DNA-binding transcriptional regulator [Desnuesiella massiliensis]